MLSKLRLSNFRCFEKIDCTLDEMTTIFIGDNAQGKTTILESICLLMRLQSPRTSKIVDQIKLGESNLSVEGTLSGKKIFYAFSGNKKRMQVDGQKFSKRKDYLQETALVVWIGNDDILLLRGGSDLRRRYLDFGASQMNLGYLSALKAYKRALRARNFLLKRDSIPNWNQIKPYTKLLIENGSVISEQRKLLVERLNTYATDFQYSISGEDEKLENQVAFFEAKPLIIRISFALVHATYARFSSSFNCLFFESLNNLSIKQLFLKISGL